MEESWIGMKKLLQGSRRPVRAAGQANRKPRRYRQQAAQEQVVTRSGLGHLA
jgi:hypothetical protein